MAVDRRIWYPNTASHWFEPQEKVRRDFTRIAFTSNWGSHEKAGFNAWMLQLPAMPSSDAGAGSDAGRTENPRHSRTINQLGSAPLGDCSDAASSEDLAS